jgi:DNA-binding CsgD family transcriptional regulator
MTGATQGSSSPSFPSAPDSRARGVDALATSDDDAIDLGEGTILVQVGAMYMRAAVWHDLNGKMVWVTKRQLQSLALALEHGSLETAHLLGLADTTVKEHLKRLYKRLCVTNKWEAATLLGWTRVPPALFE